MTALAATLNTPNQKNTERAALKDQSEYFMNMTV